jgi:hypothetical protein
MVIDGFQMDGALGWGGVGWGGGWSCVCLGHIIHVAGQMGVHVITITTTAWNVNGNPPKELPRHELDKPGFFFFFFGGGGCLFFGTYFFFFFLGKKR